MLTMYNKILFYLERKGKCLIHSFLQCAKIGSTWFMRKWWNVVGRRPTIMISYLAINHCFFYHVFYVPSFWCANRIILALLSMQGVERPRSFQVGGGGEGGGGGRRLPTKCRVWTLLKSHRFTLTIYSCKLWKPLQCFTYNIWLTTKIKNLSYNSRILYTVRKRKCNF
jgi:hypothetical protein